MKKILRFMSEINLDRLWTLLAKKLTEEASREDLLELRKLQSRYPEICYRAELIIKWWYVAKIEEQKNVERALQTHPGRMKQ
ncbi:MAG TPA: hypothetical protein VGI82_08155 [Chitinophagaceae bacterium]